MYLHLGYDDMIDLADVIAILDIGVLHHSREVRQLFERERGHGRVRGRIEEAKSLVVTAQGLRLSPISAATLAQRARHPAYE